MNLRGAKACFRLLLGGAAPVAERGTLVLRLETELIVGEDEELPCDRVTLSPPTSWWTCTPSLAPADVVPGLEKFLLMQDSCPEILKSPFAFMTFSIIVLNQLEFSLPSLPHLQSCSCPQWPEVPSVGRRCCCDSPLPPHGDGFVLRGFQTLLSPEVSAPSSRMYFGKCKIQQSSNP